LPGIQLLLMKSHLLFIDMNTDQCIGLTMIGETEACENPEIGELLPTHIDQLEQECM